MENPFDIIMQKLTEIDEKLQNIESKLIEYDISQTRKILFDTKQVSNYLKLAIPTIYDKVHKREIPFIKTSGNKLYFDKVDIDEWLTDGKVLNKSDLMKKAEDYINRNPLQ